MSLTSAMTVGRGDHHWYKKPIANFILEESRIKPANKVSRSVNCRHEESFEAKVYIVSMTPYHVH